MVDDIKAKDFSTLKSKILISNINDNITNDEMFNSIDEELKNKNCNDCSYNFSCMSLMIERSKKACFFMKFKLRNYKTIYEKNNFCLNRFVFDYIYEAINSGRLDINDFTK
jgi:hypothetical protein